MARAARTVAWLADLHTNLLFGKTGRLVNGLGALFLTLISITGAVIWWPGVRNWRRSLTVDWRANFPRFTWNLHGALAIWSVVFILLWGVSGTYLAWPQPFHALLDFLERQGLAVA